jgi:hypothetical protein
MDDKLPYPFDAEHVRKLREAAGMPVPQQATFVGGCVEANPSADALGYENADIRSMPHLGHGITMFERGNSKAWIAAENGAYVEDVTEMN